MMKLFILTFGIVTSVTLAQASEFKIGEKITLSNRVYSAGCLLQDHASLVVINVNANDVRVMHTSQRETREGDCVDGAMIHFEPHYLAALRDEIEKP
jgi:hypothetical protein